MLEQQMDQNSRARKRGGLITGVLIVIAALIMLGIVKVINTTASVKQAVQNMPEMLQDVQLTLEQMEQSRQQFMTDLQSFEQTIEPPLLDAGMQAWAEAEVTQLVERKQAAVSAFGAGDYAGAVEQLASLSEPAKALTERWDHAFEQAYITAITRFEQDDVERANVALIKALKLKPTNEVALALKQRVDVLPQVLDLLSKAKVAQVEQKLPLEAELLQQVIALDAKRIQLATRVKAIEQALKEKRFAAKITSGLQAIDSGDVATALAELNVAKSIDASRAEIKLLAERINQYQATNAQQRVITAVELSIAEDNWQKVFNDTIAGLKKYPENERLNSANQQAKTLLGIERKVASLLAKPERLSDKNIARQIRRWLNANKNVAKNSASIHEKMLQLNTQLIVAETPVAVTLRSDGKTNIIVVGKGYVGKTKKYQLNLMPGQYVLEGSRKGYRAIRVNLEVSPAIVNQEVRVICNERI